MKKAIILFMFAVVSAFLTFIGAGLHLNPWYWFTFPLFIIAFWYVVYDVDVLRLLLFDIFISKKKEVNKYSRYFNWEIKQTIYLSMRFIGKVKFHTTGFENLPKDQKYLLVSNHKSGFDPLCLLSQLQEEDVICITKPENMKIPIAGGFMHKGGYLVIDRNNNFNALKTIIKATNYIKDDTCSVVVFPEGTRARQDDLLPFHPGTFKIATKSNCPIVVCSLRNTPKIKHNFFFKTTHVYVDLLKVYYYDEYKDKSTNVIASEVQGLIQDHLNKCLEEK